MSEQNQVRMVNGCTLDIEKAKRPTKERVYVDCFVIKRTYMFTQVLDTLSTCFNNLP
jgi:hypothetical protein